MIEAQAEAYFQQFEPFIRAVCAWFCNIAASGDMEAFSFAVGSIDQLALQCRQEIQRLN